MRASEPVEPKRVTGRADPSVLLTFPPGARGAPGGRRTDRHYLASVAYRDDTDLSARQALYRYARPPVDLVPWALGLVDWRGDERVLDVGCGNGRYL